MRSPHHIHGSACVKPTKCISCWSNAAQHASDLAYASVRAMSARQSTKASVLEANTRRLCSWACRSTAGSEPARRGSALGRARPHLFALFAPGSPASCGAASRACVSGRNETAGPGGAAVRTRRSAVRGAVRTATRASNSASSCRAGAAAVRPQHRVQHKCPGAVHAIAARSGAVAGKAPHTGRSDGKDGDAHRHAAHVAERQRERRRADGARLAARVGSGAAARAGAPPGCSALVDACSGQADGQSVDRPGEPQGRRALHGACVHSGAGRSARACVARRPRSTGCGT